MSTKRILYIAQEIYPYLPKTSLSTISRQLPQAIQEKGYEIRTFMPKYGNVNERRNQLHEVIRLSGMNLIIDDSDHSLIIKVASIQPARMQVYFIDNEDYFQKRETVVDAKGVEYTDNDERSIFYIRGVMETIKKLRWIPDVIHCHGWFTALAPIYIKRGYADDPCFKDTKVVYSVFDDEMKQNFPDNFPNKLRFDTIGDAEIEDVKGRLPMDYLALSKLAIDYSDAVVQATPTISEDIKKYVADKNLPFLEYNEDFKTTVKEVDELYKKIDA